jgi:hypothetical protein
VNAVPHFFLYANVRVVRELNQDRSSG